jgi:hypothetical protein
VCESAYASLDERGCYGVIVGRRGRLKGNKKDRVGGGGVGRVEGGRG